MIYDILTTMVNENRLLLTIAAVCIPLVASVLIFRHLRKVKQDVQRRVMADPGTFKATQLGAAARVSARATRIMESMATLAGGDDLEGKKARELRGKLIQLGYYDKQAVSLYFGLRLVCAMGGAILFGFIFFLLIGLDSLEKFAFGTVAGTIIGYFMPATMISRWIDQAHIEHRSGFPDFMDLMVVCAQAGLSMEAGIAKIARELGSSYPSLARNLEFTTIEMRSGKNLSQAIDSLGKRLGIEEAKSFATLLSQSEELGSSLSQSLRAYSDDMRNKRLMKAEEKAFSLPAKLVVPLTLFVFPTLLVVLLLPVAISVSQTNF